MRKFAHFDRAVWTPSPDVQQQSHLWAIMRALGSPDIESLHASAVEVPARYYEALVGYLDLKFRKPYTSFVDVSAGMEFPKWFPGGRMNLVDSCLRLRDELGDSADAVVVADEAGGQSSLTYAALRQEVQKLANRLVGLGIAPGDCVGLFMPMGIESSIAFFACAWVGAVAVPAFSGYGPEALATRLQDCGAKLLITAAGFHRRGAWVDMMCIAREAAASVHTLDRVICVGERLIEKSEGALWETWGEAIEAGSKLGAVEAVSLDPNAPLLLIYTSGTTGRPKGIVHSHAGFLLKVASDYALAFDVQRDDRFCWVTDLGWLVGPQMMVGNAALGSTAVYYVGALDAPDWDQIWRICEREKVSILGISPTAIRGMAAARSEGPLGEHDLSCLRTFVSTGEPWDPASWRWLFDRVGRGERPIVNYSGGTEISGGILTSYAALPMSDCAFIGPVVGMDADIVIPEGEPSSAVGELIVRNIWPGMTHSFWGNRDELYLDTYWSTYPGVWRHGDLAQRDQQGWWFLRGRSDDTLKVAGRRIGPAEIESVLLQSEAVVEVAVVGIPDEMKGQAILAFVVGAQGVALSVQTLQAHVRAKLGSSLVPANIYFVAGLPKTRNGKVVRRAIVTRYLGLDPGDLSSLENLDVLLAIPQAEGVGSQTAAVSGHKR